MAAIFPELGVNSKDLYNILELYLYEIGSIPLLSGQEEIDLFKRIEKGFRASNELLLSNSNGQKNKLRKLELIVKDGQDAKNKLIISNTRLVISVAKKYIRNNVPILDLIQAGNIGLIRAIMKFDYRLGYRFSTYAKWWVWQGISRAVANQGSTIRYPSYLLDDIKRINRSQNYLTQLLGYEPSISELSEYVNLTPGKIKELKNFSQDPLSLDKPISDETDANIGDFISDNNALDPNSETINKQLCEYIDKEINNLPPKQAIVIRLRYGFSDGKIYTFDQISKKLGISRERARQLQSTALEHFGNQNRISKLREFV